MTRHFLVLQHDAAVEALKSWAMLSENEKKIFEDIAKGEKKNLSVQHRSARIQLLPLLLSAPVLKFQDMLPNCKLAGVYMILRSRTALRSLSWRRGAVLAALKHQSYLTQMSFHTVQRTGCASRRRQCIMRSATRAGSEPGSSARAHLMHRGARPSGRPAAAAPAGPGLR